MFSRVTLIVMDSLGVGALPDAAKYGDAGSDTLGHIIAAKPSLHMPNLTRLGLMSAHALAGNIPTYAPDRILDATTSIHDDCISSYAAFAEESAGKDTTSGHWEIAGLITDTPFLTFAHFPDSFIRSFESAIGVKVLGNYAESGTKIIEDLGPESERTGCPIVYTSADSVFQLAACTDVIPLERLYHMCELAREMLQGELAVGRVIARPYTITDGKRVRTPDRKDYSVDPPAPTMLDLLSLAGVRVTGIGKISDIFAGRGITESIHTISNEDGALKTIEQMKLDPLSSHTPGYAHGISNDGVDARASYAAATDANANEAKNQPMSQLIFTNLVDFDSKYGHRRDPLGYGSAIEEFDAIIPELLSAMREDELLILCADHGNDPSFRGTDHTREYIPGLFYGKRIKQGNCLGIRQSFADIGKTIMDAFGIENSLAGTSLLDELISK